MDDPPILICIQKCHCIEENGYKVCNDEVSNENHHDSPLVLSVHIGADHVLNPIELIHHEWQLQKQPEPAIDN